MSSLEQARRIAGIAQDKLAQDVVILDMRPACSYTDFFVLCTGQNPRQTAAIYDEVHQQLKHDGRLLPASVDGQREHRHGRTEQADSRDRRQQRLVPLRRQVEKEQRDDPDHAAIVTCRRS